jgi:hypothetical protein
MGTGFYPRIRQMMDYYMLAAATISPGDPDPILWTDSVDEAIAHLLENAVKQFGLRVAHGTPKSSPLLGEKRAGEIIGRGMTPRNRPLRLKRRHF